MFKLWEIKYKWKFIFWKYICGAKLYSDGKQIAPMLPEFPYFVKCKMCNTFYWLNEENKIAEQGFRSNKKEWEEADKAEFLTLNEYQEAIDLRIFNDNKEEHYIRLKYWWTFNDKIRENKNITFNENEEKLYEENCIKLISLLDENEINNKIMIAELFRNIGEFNKCIDFFNKIKEEEYSWIIDILRKECSKNNKKVVILNQ